MLNLTRSYLSGFNEISNYKQNSPLANDIAILKIISYLFLVSLGIAIYTAASLYGRFKKGPVAKDEGIADKANQVLGTASKEQSSASINQEAPLIPAVTSPTAITPIEESAPYKPVKLYIRGSNNSVPQKVINSLKKDKLFTSVELVEKKQIICDKDALVIESYHASRGAEHPRVELGDLPLIVFCGYYNEFTKSDRHYIRVHSTHMIQGENLRDYSEDLIYAIKEHLNYKASQAALSTLPEPSTNSSSHSSSNTSVKASILKAVASSSQVAPIETAAQPNLPQLYIRLESEFSTCLPKNFENSLKEAGLFSNIRIVDIKEKIDDQNAVILDAIEGSTRLLSVSNPTIYFCEASATAGQAAYMKNIVAINVKRNSQGKYQCTTLYVDEVIALLKKYIQDKTNQT